MTTIRITTRRSSPPHQDNEHGPNWFLKATKKKKGSLIRIFHKGSKKDRKDIITDLREKFERREKYKGVEK